MAHGHGAQPFAQGQLFGLRLRPAAGFALQEQQLPARRQVTAAHAQHHGRAHALGGFGLHAKFLERGAEMEMQIGVVHALSKRFEEHGDRVLMLLAALQSRAQRQQVGMVARQAHRHAAQDTHRLRMLAGFQQRVRGQGVGQRRIRMLADDGQRALLRSRCPPGLDQRMHGRQAIGAFAVQFAGLFEGQRGGRPLFALGQLLAVLPAVKGPRLGARCGRWRALRGGQGKGHGGNGRRWRAAALSKQVGWRVWPQPGGQRPELRRPPVAVQPRIKASRSRQCCACARCPRLSCSTARLCAAR